MNSGLHHLHEEKELLRLLQQGDRRAFEVIYQRFAKELFVKAYQKIGIREVCEDIIQDLFTGLWLRKERLNIQKTLGAYLHGILDNKVIDYYRQICTRLKHIDQLIEMLDQPEPSPGEQLNYKEQESALQAYISGLSGKMREIFILSRYDQLSTEEISNKLSLSNQTVRNQISKALKILRNKMEPLRDGY